MPGEYIYDILMWHIDSLPHKPHTLTLQNGIIGGWVSLVLLDYVVYTHT